MVARRENIHAAFIKLGQARFCETAAASHVLAVRDAEITAVLTHQLTGGRLDGQTPSFPDYVAYEQYAHCLPCLRSQAAEPPCNPYFLFLLIFLFFASFEEKT
jgi:hypothetical protein